MSITRLRILTMSEKPRREARSETFKARALYLGGDMECGSVAAAFHCGSVELPRAGGPQLDAAAIKSGSYAAALHIQSPTAFSARAEARSALEQPRPAADVGAQGCSRPGTACSCGRGLWRTSR